MLKKMWVLVLTFLLCASLLPFSSLTASASGVEEYNYQVQVLAEEIEARFQVEVRYPIRPDGYAAIGTATLATLESTLQYLSPTFLSQLSSFFYKENGRALTFEYAYLPLTQSELDGTTLGHLNSKECLIQLYIPTDEQKMVVTGNSPFTILHEVGHAYYYFLSTKLGSNNFTAGWTELNQGVPYNTQVAKSYNRKGYMTFYATTSLEEDFAETFAYVFGANRDGLGVGHRLVTDWGESTVLGDKVTFLENSILSYISYAYSVTPAFDKMLITQPSRVFESVTLSGNSLEYMDFNQPHGIVENNLESLKISAIQVDWYREVGGWKVKDKAGGTYLVFPGCRYVTLKMPTRKGKQ